MKRIIVLCAFFMLYAFSDFAYSYNFQASEESVCRKSDATYSASGLRIGRLIYTGGYDISRTRYTFNLAALPVDAVILSVVLKTNAQTPNTAFSYTITKTNKVNYGLGKDLFDHIFNSDKLFEYIPYTNTYYSSSSAALTALVSQNKGGSFTLGAYSLYESTTASNAMLIMSLEVTVQTNVGIIVTNNFSTGTNQEGIVKIDNSQSSAPATVSRPTGTNVTFEAITPQTDNNGYQRIWANNVTVNESEWKKFNSSGQRLDNGDNKNISYSVQNIATTENGMKYEANLRKVCNLDCQINSQAGGTVSVTANGQTSVIYPGQNIQVSVTEKNPVGLCAADQTGNGIDYVFEKWTYTENGTVTVTTSRNITFNPEYHANVTAYFKGYPNTSMMNVQNNITTVGAAPEITWTDNPNNNVSYKIQTRRYNSAAGYWEPWSSYISVAKGVGYYRKIGSVVNNNASGDGLNIKLEAYYSTENTMSLNAMNTTFNYTCLDCDGPINESKLNAGIQKETVVTKYVLANYPNPFNPTTVINYQVPEAGHVTIKVYDVMGKEIATLVDGAKNKGSYNISFSMDQYHLSSGIYFCRMQSGKNITTTKMILSK